MNKKSCSIITIVLFFAVMIAGAVWSAIIPDTPYSEREQRDLAVFPGFDSGLNYADWTAQLESSLLDQFPLRNVLIEKYHSAQAAGGNTLIQDVYNLDSDYLFNMSYPVLAKRVTAMANSLSSLSSRYKVPVVYSIVPQKNIALAEGVEGLENNIDLANLERIKAALADAGVDCADLCTPYLNNCSIEERVNYYYKGDFHWNQLGAYKAAEQLGKELVSLGYLEESELPKKSDFSWVDFTGEYQYMGDLQRRFSDKPIENEYIPYYELRDLSGLSYYTDLSGKPVNRGTIVAGGLEAPVMEYNYINTYNLGYYRIENENASSGLKALVLKDSYENAMTDYLSGLFAQMDVVDPRNPKYSIRDILKSEDFDIILCVYHENNVSEELLNYIR